jgi:DNA primase
MTGQASAAATRPRLQIDEQTLEEIKSRVSLVGLIQESVPLKKMGNVFKGCCPFHGEKTASFNVFDDHYHCFGCGAHGDAIKFVQKTRGQSFLDAVRDLAQQVGVTLTPSSPGQEKANAITDRLKLALRKAAAFYAEQLMLPAGAEALAYARQRGVTDDDIRDFKLGFAPANGPGLVRELRANGFSDAEILDAGLARQNDRGEIRDFYFGRLLFPVSNRHGDILSFGGRALGDAQPKYINGTETALYRKGHALYGYSQAAPSIRKLQRAILVEGNLDVVAMRRVGLANTVAPMGTAATVDQIRALWREAPDVVICMDGDRAGITATLRLSEKLLPYLAPDRRVSVATLPVGEDPDSLIKKGLVEHLETAVKNPVSICDFMLNSIRTDSPLNTPEGRIGFRRDIRQIVNTIQNPELACEWEEAGTSFIASTLSSAIPPAIRIQPELTIALIGTVLHQPQILHKVEDLFASLDVPHWLQPVQSEIIRWWRGSNNNRSEKLYQQLQAAGLNEVAARVTSAIDATLKQPDVTGNYEGLWESAFSGEPGKKIVYDARLVMRSPSSTDTMNVVL